MTKTHRITEAQFKAFLRAAKETEGEYSLGYQIGLRRHYHGEAFNVPGASPDAYRALDSERGEGYRDGEAGKRPRGTHPNLGNDHARRETETATDILTLRAKPSDKERWIIAACQERLTLSQWVIKHLNSAAPGEPEPE